MPVLHRVRHGAGRRIGGRGQIHGRVPVGRAAWFKLRPLDQGFKPPGLMSRSASWTPTPGMSEKALTVIRSVSR